MEDKSHLMLHGFVIVAILFGMMCSHGEFILLACLLLPWGCWIGAKQQYRAVVVHPGEAPLAAGQAPSLLGAWGLPSQSLGLGAAAIDHKTLVSAWSLV